jgi:3-methyladenine DNA glycosylase AlkD
VISGTFAGLVSKTKFAKNKMEKWIKADAEWIGRSGWLVLAHMVMSGETFSDDYLQSHLNTITESIHSRKNRVRDAMNSALIAIAIQRKTVRKNALAAAGRIGKVEVDHGETSCKTPDAAAYIKKALARKKHK